MRSAVRRMGNSSGVILPKPLLAAIGAKAGDAVEMSAEDGRIVIEPIAGRAPRGGWADEARALAEAGDDAPVWPDFANDADEILTW